MALIKTRTTMYLALVTVACIWTLIICSIQISSLSGLSRQPPTHSTEHGEKPKFAVVTFLASAFDRQLYDNDEDDKYFVGARILAYQLLHAPQTRFMDNIPFIVLVTPDVEDSKRHRLVNDGAEVIEVNWIKHNFTISEPRWIDAFSKLRMFDPDVVSYEKILYMDTDVILTRSLDGIFRDPSTTALMPLRSRHAHEGATDGVDGDKTIPLPERYLMAATPESNEQDHPYPYLDAQHQKSYFNSGFFVYSPSREIFKHYLDILGRSDWPYIGFPEQDLLNYAHQWSGPMPWKRLHFSWNLNWSNDNDVVGGIAALHVKWWDQGYFSKKAREYAFSRRWEMEGYWIGREQC